MDLKAFYQVTYGLYVVSAAHGGRRGGCVSVGRPGMKRKQGPQNTETDECQGEEPMLGFYRDMGSGDLEQVHGQLSPVGCRMEIDTQDSYQ